MMVLMAGSVVMMNFVTMNTDMTEYLPTNSSMRQGLDAMEREWPSGDSVQHSFLLMFEGLNEAAVPTIRAEINDGFGSDVTGVEHEVDNRHFNSDCGRFRLFIVSTSLTNMDYATNLMNTMESHFRAQNHEIHSYLPVAYQPDDLMMLMIPIAVVIMILVLFLMTQSLFEPIIILGGVGVAVLLNLGTNIIFPQVSDMAVPVGATLQFILSIVCSLILLVRYRREKELLEREGRSSIIQAMKNALRNSFKTIISACTATFVGLMALLLMSFTIGIDMGLVFAKGVFFTVVSVYTILPAVIIWSDKIIKKLEKKNVKAWIFKNRKKKEVEQCEQTMGVGADHSFQEVFETEQNLQPHFTPALATANAGVECGVINTSVEMSTDIKTAGKTGDNEKIAQHCILTPCEKESLFGRVKKGLGAFCFKYRFIMLVAFILLFAGVGYAQTLLRTEFSVPSENFVASVFPQDTLVIVCDNRDEGRVRDLIMFLEDEENTQNVREINAFANTLGTQGTEATMPFIIAEMGMPDELGAIVPMVFAMRGNPDHISIFDFAMTATDENVIPLWNPLSVQHDENTLRFVLDTMEMGAFVALVPMVFANPDLESISIFDFVMTISDDPFLAGFPIEQVPMVLGMRQMMITQQEELQIELFGMRQMMIEGRGMLIGQNQSRMLVTITYHLETDEIMAFYESLVYFMEDIFLYQFFFVGNSAMSFELSGTFYTEYLLISLVLALALYIVLLISLKKFLLPVILITIVQCAMFIMMSVMAATGNGIFFLAILIVQAVVKGSSLEWGVLLTNSYEEARKTMGRKEALSQAILKSGRVILTSSLCMVSVTTILGIALGAGGQVGSIMLGMGMASAASALLTMIALPSLLVIFDRFVVKRKNKGGEEMKIKNEEDFGENAIVNAPTEQSQQTEQNLKPEPA